MPRVPQRSHRSHGRIVFATTSVNLVGLALGVLTGVLLARALGDSGRGAYAAIMAWYAMALVLGEWGQSAAATFRVAERWPSRRVAVASSRLVMLPPSIVVSVVGLAASPALAHGDAGLIAAYRVAFASVALNGLLASFIYGMQAVSISAWNMIRLSQSITYFVLVAVVALRGGLTVLGAVACMAGSTAIQLSMAYMVGRRSGLAGGKAERSEVLWLGSFGLRQSASAVPSTAASSVDKVMLSNEVSPSALGDYAVAQTVIGTSGALGTAITAVSYPRLAAMQKDRPDRARLEAKLLFATGSAVLVAASGLAVISEWAIPIVYGEDFVEAVALAWWFVPVAVLQNLSLISGTLLRGRGLPGRAAWAQLLGLGALLGVLPVLIAHGGPVGAAVAMTIGSLTSTLAGLVLWVLALRPER